MSSFCIVLAEQPYRLVFAELVNVLSWGLRSLGHEVRCTTFPLERTRNIILAPHLLMASPEGEAWRPPPGTIVYNFEPHCSHLFTRSLRMLGAPGITPWDYAVQTTTVLQRLGMTDAIHVPFAFAPCLHTLPLVERDLDVVFVGSQSDRRVALIKQLTQLGVRVHTAFGSFGDPRDRMLARARIILNVHYWTDAPNEDLRIVFAAANGLCVSSEGPPDEPRKRDWAAWSNYRELAARTQQLLTTGEWRAQASRGATAVAESPGIVAVLRNALAQSRAS